MLTFDPSWSSVFDAGVCAALLWLALSLAGRGPFRALGKPTLVAVAAAGCAPVLLYGRVVSLAVACVAVPWLVVRSYRHTELPLPKASRVLLAAARIGAFVVVVLCLLRPRLAYERTRAYRACAVVLADTSASMESKDCPPDADRYAALKAVLEENEKALDAIRSTCDFRLATFAEAFQRAEELPDAPGGPRTRLADALAAVTRDLGGARAAGVVLLTDGRDNGVGDPVAAAVRIGAPVFSVCLGSAEAASELGDTAVRHVECSQRAFLENLLPVGVRVGYTGPATDRLVEVTLFVNDEKIESRRIATPAPRATTDVELRYVPQTEGIKHLVIAVTPAAQDANLSNNKEELFVRVSKSALGVLLVEGEIRWEYKFVRRAVAGAPNIKLTCVNAFLADPVDREGLLPTTEKGWEDLDLIVLGDLPAKRFKEEQLERIRRFVAEGGALLMLGGLHTLGPGQYGMTPVAKALPVDLTQADRQTFEAVQLVATEEGLEHAILAFGTLDETKAIWAELPPVSGYTRVAGAKPLARVLVETPGGDPVLAVQEYEKGRSAVLTVDTTWRWIFNEARFAHYHKAFWRQLVQWLTKSGYDESGAGLSCETDRLRYLAGDTPMLTVRAAGRRLENADITATIEGPETETRMPIGSGPGHYELGLPRPVVHSGAYEVTVTAMAGDKPVEAKTKFVVQHVDVERLNPAADPALLEQIAGATGGRAFTREDAAAAFEAVLRNRAGTQVVRTVHKRLWDNAFVYVALSALLCAEWATRKRRGLA